MSENHNEEPNAEEIRHAKATEIHLKLLAKRRAENQCEECGNPNPNSSGHCEECVQEMQRDYDEKR